MKALFFTVFLCYVQAAVSAAAQAPTLVDNNDRERRGKNRNCHYRTVATQRASEDRAITSSVDLYAHQRPDRERPGGETRSFGTILREVPGDCIDGRGRLIVRGVPAGFDIG